MFLFSIVISLFTLLFSFLIDLFTVITFLTLLRGDQNV